jgi:hypothetical protein
MTISSICRNSNSAYLAFAIRRTAGPNRPARVGVGRVVRPPPTNIFSQVTCSGIGTAKTSGYPRRSEHRPVILAISRPALGNLDLGNGVPRVHVSGNVSARRRPRDDACNCYCEESRSHAATINAQGRSRTNCRSSRMSASGYCAHRRARSAAAPAPPRCRAPMMRARHISTGRR